MPGKISIFRTIPRIVMGPGAVSGLGQEVLDLGASKCLVITDQGIIGAGLLEPVEASLKAAKIECRVFSEVKPDPPLRDGGRLPGNTRGI